MLKTWGVSTTLDRKIINGLRAFRRDFSMVWGSPLRLVVMLRLPFAFPLLLHFLLLLRLPLLWRLLVYPFSSHMLVQTSHTLVTACSPHTLVTACSSRRMAARRSQFQVRLQVRLRQVYNQLITDCSLLPAAGCLLHARCLVLLLLPLPLLLAAAAADAAAAVAAGCWLPAAWSRRAPSSRWGGG